MQVLGPIASANAPLALVVFWRHRFQAVENPATAVATALVSLGYTVYLAHSTREEDMRVCHDLRERFDLCISIGAPAIEASRNGRRLFEFVDCPHYYWLLDPIYYDLGRNEHARAYLRQARRHDGLHFLCPDRGTAAILETWCPGRAHFFPFGGFFTPLKPAAKRPRQRVAVFATIGHELGPVSHARLDDVVAEAESIGMPRQAREALCAAIQSPSAPSDPMQVLHDFFRLPVDRLLTGAMVSLICRIDAFEKRRRRAAVAQALAGVPIDYYGLGWEPYLAGRPDCAIKPLVSHTMIGEIAQRYVAVLNFDPHWDEGVHDRVFTALGSGCLVISNENSELPVDAIANGHIFRYRAKAPQFGDALRAFLATPQPSPEAVERYRLRYSWLARVDRFLAGHLARRKATTGVSPQPAAGQRGATA